MAIEEVRIVTTNGTAHRGFEDEHGVLYTAEADNLDQAEERVIVRRASPSAAFRYPEIPATKQMCQRCLQ